MTAQIQPKRFDQPAVPPTPIEEIEAQGALGIVPTSPRAALARVKVTQWPRAARLPMAVFVRCPAA
jgi:hypothetical protein